MKLIVVPEARRQAAEAVVTEALGEKLTAGDFAFTLIRLPGRVEWTVHASGAAGVNADLARLIQRKLREAGL